MSMIQTTAAPAAAWSGELLRDRSGAAGPRCTPSQRVVEARISSLASIWTWFPGRFAGYPGQQHLHGRNGLLFRMKVKRRHGRGALARGHAVDARRDQ